MQKKNRIVLRRKEVAAPGKKCAPYSVAYSCRTPTAKLKLPKTSVLWPARTFSEECAADLLFANKIVKHSKSNAIVLARNGQLIASGVGRDIACRRTEASHRESRHLRLRPQRRRNGFRRILPFADCVEIAHKAGIDAVIQPGGSIRDTDSVDYCREHGMTMVMTGFRHFRHH